MSSICALVERIDTHELEITDARFLLGFNAKWKEQRWLWPDETIWHKYEGNDLDVPCKIKFIGDESECQEEKLNLVNLNQIQSDADITIVVSNQKQMIDDLKKKVADMELRMDSLVIELNQIKIHQIESQSICAKVPIKIVGNLSVPMSTIHEALVIGFNNKGFSCLVNRVFGNDFFYNKSWRGLSKEVQNNLNNLLTTFVTTGVSMSESSNISISQTEKRKQILSQFQSSLNVKKYYCKKDIQLKMET